MTPYPDNISPQTFAPEPNHDAATDMVSRDVQTARLLRERIVTFLDGIQHLQFETICPARGFDMVDIIGAAEDWRDSIDLGAFARRAREIALEMER